MSDWIPTTDQLEAITGASTLADCPMALVGYNWPDADYRRIHALNNSFLWLMEPMPASAKVFFEPRDADHFKIGRYVHQALLTPHDPVPKFAVFPEKLRGNARELWEAEARSAGLEVFTRDDYRQWSGCVRSLAANPRVQELMAAGKPEVSCFAVIEVGGVQFRVKTRIDWVPDGGTALVNFKTTAKGGIGRRKFNRDLYELHYGGKAAFELFVWNLCHPDDQRTEYVWPVVEKSDPHCIRCYVTTPLRLAEFEEAMNSKLHEFAKAIREGVFRGDDLEYQSI